MDLQIVKVGPSSGQVAFSAGHDSHSAPNLHVHHAFSCHGACQVYLALNLFTTWCSPTGHLKMVGFGHACKDVAWVELRSLLRCLTVWYGTGQAGCSRAQDVGERISWC